MADPTSEFFESLERHGAPQLEKVTANIRIDLDRGKATERRLVTVEKGKISVSRRNTKADAGLRTDKDMFDRLAQGEANPFASLLRGLVQTEGDAELIVLFQGLFPASSNQARADKER